MTSDFEKLLESYAPYADELNIPRNELRDALLQLARAAVKHKNRCLNCALSRADRKKNEENVRNQGALLLQARVCVLGLNSNMCGGVRKPIVPDTPPQES